MNEFDEFKKELLKFGVTEVGAKLSQGVWASHRKKWAQDWLASQRQARESEQVAISAAAAERTATNAEATTRVTEESLQIAKSAKNAAWVAALAAIAAAIFAFLAYAQGKA